MNRSRAAKLGQEVVEILQRGSYMSPSGKTISIREGCESSVAKTEDYPPDRSVPAPQSRDRTTSFTVVNETTLAAAARLAERRPLALNFASAKNPGGGFLSGARAQEESLARSSALYACLNGRPMYEHHRALHNPMYTDWAMISPDVPVFRDDEGALLEEPYPCSFLTAPAVNAKVVRERNGNPTTIAEVMDRRVRRVLGISAHHGHDTLILGAWGCGVFGNSPDQIAGSFRSAFDREFAGVFSTVAFAVLDFSSNKETILPFQRRFA